MKYVFLIRAGSLFISTPAFAHVECVGDPIHKHEQITCSGSETRETSFLILSIDIANLTIPYANYMIKYFNSKSVYERKQVLQNLFHSHDQVDYVQIIRNYQYYIALLPDEKTEIMKLLEERLHQPYACWQKQPNNPGNPIYHVCKDGKQIK